MKKAVITLAALIGSCQGQTYKTRPLFQAPYGCAQMWRSTSYSSHGESLDLSQWNSKTSKTIEDEGNFVRAAHAGKVIEAYTVNDPTSDHHGANRIRIDDQNGWRTYYSHMRDNVDHMLNRWVAQGEVIGYTGTTGKSSGPHIHIDQEAQDQDDNSWDDVRQRYNGQLIDTHAGSFGSVDYILSNNCVGENFMSWTYGTTDYFAIYKPQSGLIKFNRINTGSPVGTTETYEASWSMQWTHMVAYKMGSTPMAILYKQRTGEVKFIQIKTDGSGYTLKKSGTWGTGWTHIVPFSSGGYVYLMVYNSVNGRVSFERVNANNDATTNLSKHWWTKGRTVITPFHKSKQYVSMYIGGTGGIKFLEMTFSYNSVSWSTAYSSTWTKGWTHMVDYNIVGTSYMLAYKQETGTAKILKYNTNANGVTTPYSSTWTKTWTHISPFYVGTTGHVLMYKTGTGYAQIMRMKSNGYTKLFGKYWTTGWN
eukprot:TRINITY_DN1419_c1_g1_i1.p1 TRINITY_DN1419_c1_g1~~TRINITY_DN1419_c1_g1_i1.p1  ORF type:complete len:493 (+),score=114.82 TRINITY_DN1419_c1_g1_i1:46-1479(+)